MESVKRVLTLVGEVISDKMEKTVVVKVIRVFKHAEFGKVLKASKNYKVHDPYREARVGDVIEVQECRPISKTKHMKLSKIITRKAI